MPDATQSTPLGSLREGQARTASLSEQPDSERASLVLVEILRQLTSGNSYPLVGRAELTQLFWLAHLYYARRGRGYLTAWPFIRTPNGFEIHKGVSLVEGLVRQGLAGVKEEEFGPLPRTLYFWTGKALAPDLAEQAVEAIRQALAFFHANRNLPWGWYRAHSRAWEKTPDGEEVDIYLDLIPDRVYEEETRMLQELDAGLKDLFG